MGNYSEAISYLEESIGIYESFGDNYFANVSRSETGHAYRKSGDLDKAFAIYSETILNWQDLGNRGAVANQLECFSFIAVENGQWDRAARLLGAAEVLRELSDTQMLVYEQQEYEQYIARLKERAEEKRFEQTWRAGRQMEMEEAVAYALNEL
jgi:non-specific serine/threonine protein kinase